MPVPAWRVKKYPEYLKKFENGDSSIEELLWIHLNIGLRKYKIKIVSLKKGVQLKYAFLI